jgi:hypothetical protein
MVLLSELVALGRQEAGLGLNVVSTGHPSPDGCLSALSIRLSVEILTNEAGNVSIVAGDLLLAHLVSGTSDPVRGITALVTENVFKRFVFGSHSLK